MNLTKEQLSVFKKAFRLANDGEISLPKKIDFEKITHIQFWTDGMRGGNSSTFVFLKNDAGEPYLEFNSSNEFMSFHKIIEQSGKITELINYTRQVGVVDFSFVMENLIDGKSINPKEAEQNDLSEKKERDKKLKVDSRISYWSGFKNLFK
ncbi:hypothetical protein [Maribacter sp. Asnod1-A12]|uniref:hypothetical protein n=1 Tax=Maribacter sp. Asnod1-A12 TaxID=3160576 RepID=UPI00386D4ECC